MWWMPWSKEDLKRIEEMSPEARFGYLVLALVVGLVTLVLCVTYLG
jgi:hypothetical protein